MLPGVPARRGGAGKKLAQAARLLARGELTDGTDDAAQADQLDEQLAFWGIPQGPVAPPSEVFYLWPENLPAWKLWLAVRTQWHHGFDGPTGAIYQGWEIVMRRRRIPPRERDRYFALLQAMELGALEGWKQLRDEREANAGRE